MIDVRLFDDLALVEADAAGALDRAVQPALYDRIAWLRLNALHAVVAGAPIVARARDGDAAVWLFLAAEGRRRAGAYGHWYTLSFAPICGPGTDGANRVRLIAAIARTLRRRLDRITLAPVPAGSCEALKHAFTGAGWWVRAEIASANWVAHVAGGDFATYWARRPSRLRNTFRRKQKEAGLEIMIHDGFDAEGWADYEAVYAASWKPEEGSPDFLRALARQEGAAGTVRLGIARRDGHPVAAQFWTVENGTATIHKLAYVAAERARSPGTVLSEAMFRHVIDRDRPQMIDFGTGDDAYKADWMDEKRPLYQVRLFNRYSPAGWAGAGRAAIAAWRARAA